MVQQLKSRGHVIVFPARVPPIGSGRNIPASDRGTERRIYFLSGVCQVEDILRETEIYTVPFSPPYIEGITEWREHVAPVISPEGYMGLVPRNQIMDNRNTRFIMMRVSGQEGEKYRIVFRASSYIRMIPLPIQSEPVACLRDSDFETCPWLKSNIQNSELVRGIYEWEEGYLLALRIMSLFI